MANIAIRGHKTRGKEVIQLLEMLGGKNMCYWEGDDKYRFYYIDEYNHIQITCGTLSYILFDLEEFEKKYPYKVGDKVLYGDVETIIKNREWDLSVGEMIYFIDVLDITKGVYIKDLQPYKEQEMKNLTISNEEAVKNVIKKYNN